MEYVELTEFDQRFMLEVYQYGDGWPYTAERIDVSTRLRARMIDLIAIGLTPGETATYLRNAAKNGPKELEDAAREVTGEMVDRCCINFAVGRTTRGQTAFECITDIQESEATEPYRIIESAQHRREKTEGLDERSFATRSVYPDAAGGDGGEEMRCRIRDALFKAGGNRTQAAIILQMSSGSFFRRLQRWPELRLMIPAAKAAQREKRKRGGRVERQICEMAIKADLGRIKMADESQIWDAALKADGKRIKIAKGLGICRATLQRRLSHNPGLWRSIEKELCKMTALKCQTRGEFQKKFNARYLLARRRGWLDELASHMPTRHEVMKQLAVNKHARLLQMWEDGRTAEEICEAMKITDIRLRQITSECRRNFGLFPLRDWRNLQSIQHGPFAAPG